MQTVTENELDRECVFGKVIISLKDNSSLAKYDRLVHDGKTLKLLSLVAEANHIKAIRAMLAPSRGTAGIKAEGYSSDVGTKHPSSEEYNRQMPGWLKPDEVGYTCDHHKLEHGLVHATYLTKDPNFIARISPDSLWATLMSERFTTPLLKQWMPWLTQQLIREELLAECRCYRAVSAVLRMSNSVPLDTIVSSGIRSGELELKGSLTVRLPLKRRFDS